ncbi:MAG: DUF5678 domain-containing protein [Candidatus Woesearchaeota archaeon]
MVNSYTNYEWFLKKDLSSYSGKWVAIIDKKIIASGTTASAVIKESKHQYPTKRPFITKVRDKLSIL